MDIHMEETEASQRPELVSRPVQGDPKPAWRELYTLAGMRGLSFAGDIVAETAIILYLQAKGAGSYAVMAVLMAAALPPVLLAPLTGRVADRCDSRRIIVTAALIQAMVCAAMMILLTPLALIILSAVLSAGLAFTHPVFGGLPRAMVGKENVPRAASISQGTAMAGMVIAPALGGFLTAQLGVRLPLLIDAASFVLVALGGLYIRTRLHAQTGPMPQNSAENIAHAPGPEYRVLQDRFLRALLILSGTVMAAACIINVLIVFYVRESFHASEGTYGLVMSAWMVGMVPGAVIVNRLRDTRHEVVLVGTFVAITVAILGVGFAPGVWWIAPFYVLGGLGNGAQATVAHVLMNLRIPEEHRGRAFAALGAVSNSGPVIGFLVGGVLLSVTGPRQGFFVAGALAAVAIVVFAPGLVRDDRRMVARAVDIEEGPGVQAGVGDD